MIFKDKKTLHILIAISFITLTEANTNEKDTDVTKQGTNNNSPSDDKHEDQNLHTTSKTSNYEGVTATNSTDGRRYYTNTQPDLSDPNFQSLLNEYRSLVNVPQVTTENQKLDKVSISALITGHSPVWVSVGRQMKSEEQEYEYEAPSTSAGAPVTTESDVGKPAGAGAQAAARFTTPTPKVRSRRRRTTPLRISMYLDCDYNAYYCLKAFDTGKVCGKSLFMTHYTFKSYCLLDFVNCMERFEAWVPAYMGQCFTLKLLTEYKQYHYHYENYRYLKDYYVIDTDYI